ncbi:type II toxin-antitoxin system VapC family toxin [Sphingomonas sp. NIBR02145]|uniref:type II toxin-antitoxin system VapC family toxin n=1 Tax=Sphingomonas sp. NIBR02145 TaxID=3014784 RepID=UPI0022B3B706|nr:type II toxin-antitoxin system VapC family toxin [Sphingomonas sp. NIBR02145]WHU03391.1 type II toxin-antitoxin system VapC family toxin [Sphingomonas sp. NIBR02145]
MRYLLDTNICILLFGVDHPRLKERVRLCDEGELAISAITCAELAFGSANGKIPHPFVLDAFLRQVPVLDFDLAAAKGTYPFLPFKRASFDRLIAAHAIARGLTLITNNERDFADIPELRIENWTL